jgi:hypothetical protein
MAEIPLREDFSNDEGRFVNYDTQDLDQREQLAKQKHVDIRSFVGDDLQTQTRLTMLYLDLNQMDEMELLDMEALEGLVVARRGEAWTVGTVERQADRNNWRGITLSCIVGVNTTESVLRGA